ncbi:transposable element Tcb1 transposase [Trichonephila clavipes]|nr:transposable element Tcb1 transposase [Trichonephila clavipes]
MQNRSESKTLSLNIRVSTVSAAMTQLKVRTLVVKVRKQRSAFDQVSEFDRGRTVAYRDCGLPFREIGSRVGRNQTTVMRICDRWMQESTTDRRGRSHPPQCTTSREDRQIVRMAVTDRSVTSRTIAQHIESERIIQCLRVPFDTIYSRVVCPEDVYCLVYP